MANAERTLVLLKPDAVNRGLIGPLLTRYEQRGLKLVGLKLATITEAQAREHYSEHVEKGFFPALLNFITSGPSVQLVVEGPDAIRIVRDTNGATKPNESAPGTIRADYGITIDFNLVHGSDGVDAASKEIAIYFSAAELIEYTRAVDAWIV
ncbi:MAG: nucleoside-diphosphate kinase [Thermomicrobiales bacterium]